MYICIEWLLFVACEGCDGEEVLGDTDGGARLGHRGMLNWK